MKRGNNCISQTKDGYGYAPPRQAERSGSHPRETSGHLSLSLPLSPALSRSLPLSPALSFSHETRHASGRSAREYRALQIWRRH